MIVKLDILQFVQDSRIATDFPEAASTSIQVSYQSIGVQLQSLMPLWMATLKPELP